MIVCKLRDKLMNDVNRLSIEGHKKQALQLLYTSLAKQPADHEARKKLRELMPNKMESDVFDLISGFETFLRNKNTDLVLAAASGWQYARALDHNFIDPALDFNIKKTIRKRDSEPQSLTEDYEEQQVLCNYHLLHLKKT